MEIIDNNYDNRNYLTRENSLLTDLLYVIDIDEFRLIDNNQERTHLFEKLFDKYNINIMKMFEIISDNTVLLCHFIFNQKKLTNTIITLLEKVFKNMDSKIINETIIYDNVLLILRYISILLDRSYFEDYHNDLTMSHLLEVHNRIRLINDLFEFIYRII